MLPVSLLLLPGEMSEAGAKALPLDVHWVPTAATQGDAQFILKVVN